MLFESRVIKKAKEGDSGSLEKLYKESFKKIYVFVRHKVATNEEAEDICAEAFIKAFENIKKFNEQSSFKSWLYAIAKNLIFDYYKAKSKVGHLENIDEEEDKSTITENTNNTVPDGRQVEMTIKNIFKDLKENYREVLELRFLLNYNIKETAEIMKVSEANVKVLQNRALKKAQDLLLQNKL